MMLKKYLRERERSQEFSLSFSVHASSDRRFTLVPLCADKH